MFSINQLVFPTQPILRSPCKDVLPPHYVSSVIYNYKSQWESEYIGRTNQMLETTIDQHWRSQIRAGK